MTKFNHKTQQVTTKPDYKMAGYKILMIFAVVLIAGLLTAGNIKYRAEQQKANSCYIDSSSYDIHTYMAYGKGHHDTVYEQKCFVKK